MAPPARLSGNGCGSGAMGLLPRRSLVRKAPYVASGAVREFERTGGRNRLSLLERIQKSQGEPVSPPKPPARALQPPAAPPPAPPAPRSAPSAPPAPPPPPAAPPGPPLPLC